MGSSSPGFLSIASHFKMLTAGKTLNNMARTYSTPAVKLLLTRDTRVDLSMTPDESDVQSMGKGDRVSVRGDIAENLLSANVAIHQDKEEQAKLDGTDPEHVEDENDTEAPEGETVAEKKARLKAAKAAKDARKNK